MTLEMRVDQRLVRHNDIVVKTGFSMFGRYAYKSDKNCVYPSSAPWT